MTCFVSSVSSLSCEANRGALLTKPYCCSDKPTQLTKSELAVLTDNSPTTSPATGSRRPAAASPSSCHACHTCGCIKISYMASFCCHFADLPPSRATSLLRLCNQSCTDSGLHTHFCRSLSLHIRRCAFRKGNAKDLSVCKNVIDYILKCAVGRGDTCVRTGAFSPATWPGQALARTTAVPRSSQAFGPLSGQARGGVSTSGFFSSPLQTRQGTARAHALISSP